MTKEEFADIYEEFFPKIYNSVYYRLNDVSLTEDLVSQIFLKILKNKDRYDRNTAKISTWIYTIAHNSLIDFYRKNEPFETIEAYEEFLSYEENHQEKIDNEITLHSVMNSLEKLPAKTREIIALHVFEELSFVEIAKIIGIGESGVKMSFARGIEAIKNSMNLIVLLLSFLLK